MVKVKNFIVIVLGRAQHSTIVRRISALALVVSAMLALMVMGGCADTPQPITHSPATRLPGFRAMTRYMNSFVGSNISAASARTNLYPLSFNNREPFPEKGPGWRIYDFLLGARTASQYYYIHLYTHHEVIIRWAWNYFYDGRFVRTNGGGMPQ